MPVTYGLGKISSTISIHYKHYCPMQCCQSAPAHFDMAVGYVRKMFMKLTQGCQIF